MLSVTSKRKRDNDPLRVPSLTRVVLSQPMIYLSAQQEPVIQKIQKCTTLRGNKLPCWVPAQEIAEALGLGHAGIQLALKHTQRPYVWATELENVHTLWKYDEPSITVDGQTYDNVEEYYHAQKPNPYDDEVWRARRQTVMTDGLRAKLKADPTLRELLLSTWPHPLLSLKKDRVWGFDPEMGGDNLLAKLWETLREEIIDEEEGEAASEKVWR